MVDALALVTSLAWRGCASAPLLKLRGTWWPKVAWELVVDVFNQRLMVTFWARIVPVSVFKELVELSEKGVCGVPTTGTVSSSTLSGLRFIRRYRRKLPWSWDVRPWRFGHVDWRATRSVCLN